jgi:large subunit ribosomal protein L23
MKDIIFKPIISEKLNLQADKLNRYGFVVSKTANKIQIRKAVQDLYNVSVTSVNTIRYGGKAKSRNTRAGIVVGRTNAYKKAYVTLANGEKIDFYSNI